MRFRLTWCVVIRPLKTVNKNFGVTIDNKLNLARHLLSIIKNAYKTCNVQMSITEKDPNEKSAHGKCIVLVVIKVHKYLNGFTF